MGLCIKLLSSSSGEKKEVHDFKSKLDILTSSIVKKKILCFPTVSVESKN